MSLSKLENLANEILLDTFDYLRPLDIICAFSLLNIRFEALIIQRSMHVNLSTNISFHDFHVYCSSIFLHYSLTIHSIHLSNLEMCGSIKVFLTSFPSIEITFPNLHSMSFIEPNEHDYKQIIRIQHLQSIRIKSKKMFEQQIHPALLFHNPHLITCVLSYDDVLSVNKLRPHSSLRRLTLDSFYINDLHTLFFCYPSLEHLTIHRLVVNFQGFLPPFNAPVETLRTLKLNCVYTVRFDYIAYVLSFLPRLIRLTLVAIGIDFLNVEQWRKMLTLFTQLHFLVLDIKAVSNTFNNELISTFASEIWHPWHVAIDYSQDNQKIHLFTIPYRRCSFISTTHCFPVTQASLHVFYSVTDLYLKTNSAMQICVERTFPNVCALQIYQNALVTVNSSTLFTQLCTMLDLRRLAHFELFIPLPTSIFLALLELTPCLRYFKTDYHILMTLTDHFQNPAVCSHLRTKLDKFVIRHDALPMTDNDCFLEIFLDLKHLQFNLNTIDDLRQIVSKYVKRMTNLLTLHIRLIGTNESSDTLQWEGIVNNISYQIAKRHIKLWK